jgi:SAM-dependent MidA family methyltransferase
MPDDLMPWSTAWTRAATGPGGFYRRESGLAEQHFATNVSASPATAQRILEVAGADIERLLTTHGSITITDVGAGDGSLLAQLMELVDGRPGERITWRAIDLRCRPPSADRSIDWITGDATAVTRSLYPSPGVVIAHELLDDIPCVILEVEDDGSLRTVVVDPRNGREHLGTVVTYDAWCERWWRRREPAGRIEVGRSRDEAWRSITGIVSDGLAIAVDYGHVSVDRDSGLWDAGTLTAFREGRLVPVVPDGSCNITAHVAMDACAAAAPAQDTRLVQAPDGLWWLTQRMAR